MKKIPLEIIGLSPSHLQSGNSFAIILGEAGGKRRLLIVVGMFEAQAIAIEMEKIRPGRPMTHDLFKSFSEKFKFFLQEVIIYDFREGVFISKIVGTRGRGDESVEVDARTSDALAIALRFDITVYVYDDILKTAGIVMNEDEEDEEDLYVQEEDSPSYEEKLRRLHVKDLKELLKKTLAKEEYEKAAHIRDEINRRN